MLICTAADIETPLTVMMILWANIIGKFLEVLPLNSQCIVYNGLFFS
jgi:hypothetical protein